jgi:plastocyanin
MRMRCSWNIVTIAVLATSLSGLSTDVYAGTLKITLSNQSGDPIINAVISAYPQNKTGNSPIKPKEMVIIDQIDKEFINHVTPIQVGTAINFPNHDQIRHHIYSLSAAKNFEIPLYKGLPAKPIIFDQAGIVVLGCNIHDQMLAYIVVLDSPYFAASNEQGLASLTLPVGDYELKFWHRDADQQSKNNKQAFKLEAGQDRKFNHKLNLKPSWNSKRASFSIRNRGRYR